MSRNVGQLGEMMFNNTKTKGKSNNNRKDDNSVSFDEIITYADQFSDSPPKNNSVSQTKDAVSPKSDFPASKTSPDKTSPPAPLTKALSHLEPQQRDLILKNLKAPVKNLEKLEKYGAKPSQNAENPVDKLNLIGKKALSTATNQVNADMLKDMDKTAQKLDKPISDTIKKMLNQPADTVSKIKTPPVNSRPQGNSSTDSLADAPINIDKDTTSSQQLTDVIEQIKKQLHHSKAATSADKNSHHSSVSPMMDAPLGKTLINSTTYKPVFGSAATVENQITNAIKYNFIGTNKNITIDLNPAELGRVIIEFSQTDQEIQGTVKVENQDTKNDIEKALPEIIKTLQSVGVNLKKIDVTLNSKDSTHTENRHSQSQYQPNSNSSGEQENTVSADNSSEINTAVKSEDIITDNSLNLYV